MLQVWRSLPEEVEAEELLDYLAPILVRTAAEQERFREQREDYARLLGRKLGTAREEEVADTPGEAERAKAKSSAHKPRQRLYLLLSVLLAALLSWGIWALLPEPPEPEVAGDTPANLIDTSATVGCMKTAALNYDSTATRPCDNCCIYEIIGCTDSTALNYNPKATEKCEDCCDYPKTATVASLARQDSISWTPTPSLYNDELPRLTSVDDSWLGQIGRNKQRISWLLFAITLSLSLGWLLWRRARRDYLARQRRSQDPPYRLPIKIRRGQALEMDEQFYFVLDRLRAREAGERQRMDIPATLRATIRQGGFPALRFRALTRPADYLILIDRQAEQNHQSQLFEYIYEQFVQQEVHAERFFFDGDPRYCWNADHPKGLPLEQLLQRYGQSRLLLFADGYSFIDPVSGRLENWVSLLGQWQQRALLTPAPAGSWNYREGRLGEFFLLLPSSVGGLLQLVRHFEELATPSLREWKYELETADRHIAVDEERVVESLQEQMAPEQLRWVAACAVYPELHWDLTVAIGEAVRRGERVRSEEVRGVGAEKETPIRFTEIRELARLPWFREGYMPQPVRAQLLESDLLSEEESRRVRAAIVQILLVNAPENPNSHAYEEYQLHLALNQMLASELPEQRRRWLKRYRELHGRGLREDRVTMAAVDRHYRRGIDFLLPKTLIRQLFPAGRRALGWRSGIPVLMALLLALGVWGALQLLPEGCGGTAATLPDSEEVFCLSGRADSLHYYQLRANAFGRAGQLDSLAAVAEDWAALCPDEETPGPLYRIAWDAAARHYRRGSYVQAANTFAWIYGTYSAEEECLAATDTARLRAREYEGYSHWRAGQSREADSIRADLSVHPLYRNWPHPNLGDLLDYRFVDSAHYGSVRVRQEGRYGFLDAATGQRSWKGNTLPYDYARNYQRDSLSGDTLALVTTGGEQCLVDLRGQAQSCFTELFVFQDRNTDLYGYRNERGLEIIPAQYEEAGEFAEEGLAWVKFPEARYGYIRPDGTVLQDRKNFGQAYDFVNGLAIVRFDGKLGYLNTSGDFAIPPQYERAGDFDDNGIAEVARAGRQYQIDRSGRCVGGDCPRISYRGRILGSLSNAPITGAALEIERLPGQNLPTDEEGYYTFTLPEGQSPAGWIARIQLGDGEVEAFNLQIENAESRPVALATHRLEQKALETDEAPDDDEDGVSNTEDRCPDDPGPAALRGCPDRDGDSIPDIDDRCPDEKGVEAEQGCPLPDEAPEGEVGPLPEMVRVPGGDFLMGDVMGDNEENDEQIHPVTLSSFEIGRYEVTFAQYDAFCEASGRDKPDDRGWGRGRRPVIYVSWYDAVAYCNWLSDKRGYEPVYELEGDEVTRVDWAANGYRLPTEAEWEYAARGGGKKVRFGNGKDIARASEINFNASEANKEPYSEVGQYRGETVPVGSLNSPNGLGLHDMSGNVWEWCWDWYGSDYYSSSPEQNPRGPDSGSYRVRRGGRWSNNPQGCRAAIRYGHRPTYRDSLIGFRLARSL